MPDEQPPPSDLLPSAADWQIVAIRDVIVCATGEDDHSIPLEEFYAYPPVGTEPAERFNGAVLEVNLGDGIKLGRVSDNDAERIMDACAPAGQNFSPVRQFGQRYAFYINHLVEKATENLYDFDIDRLGVALALSRLIRDNGFSHQYAARVIEHAGTEPTIRPLAATEGHVVYRLHGGREWLDGAEAEELASLLEAYRSIELPSRVREALWRSEYASHMARGDIMLATIVSGLEALLKVGRSRPENQFKRRAAALACDLSVEGVDEALCERAYKGRSDWVHANLEGGPGSEKERRRWIDDAAKMRDLLRVACRKAVEDNDFRAIFRNGQAINRRWPAPAPKQRKRTLRQRFRILLRG